MTVTLAQLRSRVRIRADIEGEEKRYPDTELDEYINASYKELYAKLVRKMLIRPEEIQTIVTTGAQVYSVNSNHFATLGVFYDINGDWQSLLARHSAKLRPFGITSTVSGDATSYRIAEVAGVKQIEFYPRPTNRTYYLQYVPLPGELVNDTDSVDEILAWTEYVVVDAAIKALRKENSDTDALQGDKLALDRRIEEEAELVEMAESYRITDVNRRTLDDPADYRWYRPSTFPY